MKYYKSIKYLLPIIFSLFVSTSNAAVREDPVNCTFLNPSYGVLEAMAKRNPAYAQQVIDGLRLMKNVEQALFFINATQTYQDAFALLNPYAQTGWACAQEKIGYLYYSGSPDFPKNYKLAKRWYELAASQGNIEALNALGIMHYNGLGIPINHEKAIYFFQQAAYKGHLGAINTLRKLNLW